MVCFSLQFGTGVQFSVLASLQVVLLLCETVTVWAMQFGVFGSQGFVIW